MAKYISDKDRAKTLRAELKAAGYKARAIGVRCSGSSINVTIKDPTVSKVAVEEIAHRQERIDRCDASGEILAGGNTFVFVDYSREAAKVRAATIIDRLPADPAKVDTVEIDGWTICPTGIGSQMRAFNPQSADHGLFACNLHHIALAVADAIDADRAAA